MKNILALAFLLFASFGVFGQETTIKQSEFDTIFKNSFRWRSGQPYRETRTQESVFEVLPQNDVSDVPTKFIPPPRKTLIRSVSEHVPGVGYRSVFEFDAASLKKRNETVKIGDKTYTREGENGEWTETITRIVKPADAIRIRENVTVKTGIEIETEYKFLGNEIFDGQNVKVYAKIENSKSIDSRNNRESHHVTTTKHFYAENGKLLKTESVKEIRGENTVGRFVAKTLYEIDPSIKITAPQ